MSYTVSAYDVTGSEPVWLYRLEGLEEEEVAERFAHRATALDEIGYHFLGFDPQTQGVRFGHNPNYPGRELELRVEGPKGERT